MLRLNLNYFLPGEEIFIVMITMSFWVHVCIWCYCFWYYLEFYKNAARNLLLCGGYIFWSLQQTVKFGWEFDEPYLVGKLQRKKKSKLRLSNWAKTIEYMPQEGLDWVCLTQIEPHFSTFLHLGPRSLPTNQFTFFILKAKVLSNTINTLSDCKALAKSMG